MRWFATFSVAAAGAFALAASAQSPQRPQTLLITGSSTLAPLVTEIARRFERAHPGVAVTVEAGGSGRGVRDAREGKADIGMVSRALAPVEADLTASSIARDGIAIIVSRPVNVDALTQAQVRAIYVGTVTNWKAVGGSNGPIQVVTRDKGFSSLELMKEHFGLGDNGIKAQGVAGDNENFFKVMAGRRDAIGYVSLGEAERRSRAGEAIKLVAIDGLPTSSESIKAGDYPITPPLNLVTRGRPVGLAKAFIEYALSRKVTDLVDRFDFVPYQD